MSREEIIGALHAALPTIQRKYHVRKLALFGSAARGEQTATSDVDLLVEFDEPIGFFDFVRLEQSLGEILHAQVDLVSMKALKPAIRNEVLSQAVYV
jgi:predicted nucleotidyltransferase